MNDTTTAPATRKVAPDARTCPTCRYALHALDSECPRCGAETPIPRTGRTRPLPYQPRPYTAPYLASLAKGWGIVMMVAAVSWDGYQFATSDDDATLLGAVLAFLILGGGGSLIWAIGQMADHVSRTAWATQETQQLLVAMLREQVNQSDAR